ncbi:hypothetical protein [Alteromonas halophila]|uniref:Membrane protein n=1 Tax=Alteromonas halophila TaxID=516698 RepID=A0A918MW01_9ALTE|nr:hypothetical protein [Alteromonas halophila]GGW75267.1 membrane protein [Alteromonas halophila]
MQLLPDPLMTFYQSLMWLHIGTGVIALITFWLPLMVPRGSKPHKRFGAWYITSMYIICGTGAIMATMVLISPQYFKPDLFNQASDIAATEAGVRRFWFFLLFLCVFIFTGLRQALFALNEQPGLRSGQTWRPKLLPALLLGVSLMLGVLAVSASHILFAVFSLLGVVNALSMLRYLLKASVTRKQQIIEHIGSICGTGIGVFTAFFAFGGRTLFDGLGQWQLAFWIIPGIVGTGLIAYAVRPYKGARSALLPTGTSQSRN